MATVKVKKDVTVSISISLWISQPKCTRGECVNYQNHVPENDIIVMESVRIDSESSRVDVPQYAEGSVFLKSSPIMHENSC